MSQKIGDIYVELGARIDKLEQGLKTAESRTSSSANKMQKGMSSAFSKIGAAAAAAFSVAAITNFTKESIELAAKTEGVRQAFLRLDGVNLTQLRQSTRGTVGDLELMQAAVKANNFKIPLQQLGTFFEFATKRAAQTGESVDYLVNSIVLGIGRKSPLILDNLGISAVELRERLKGVGVEAASIGDISSIMGDIVYEELERMGDVALTTQQRIEQTTSRIAALKTEIGNKLAPLVERILTNISKYAGMIEESMLSPEDKEVRRWERTAEAIKKTLKTEEQRAARYESYAKSAEKAMDKWQQELDFGTNRAKDVHEWLALAEEELWYWDNLARESRNTLKDQKEGIDEVKMSVADLTASLNEFKELQSKSVNRSEWLAWEQDINRIQKKIDAITVGSRSTDNAASIATGRGMAGQAATAGLNTTLGTGAEGIVRIWSDLDPKMAEIIHKQGMLNHDIEDYNEFMQYTGQYVSMIASGFADALVNGEDFGEAMTEVFKQMLSQMIALVAQALIFTAIMAAFSGGLSSLGGFGAVFKSNLLSGGGGFQPFAFLQGDTVWAAANRGETRRGR